MIKISRPFVQQAEAGRSSESVHLAALYIGKDESRCSVSSFDNEIELCFGSDLALLDLVQGVSDNVSQMLNFEGDAQYWTGLSVREAVTNAIQHGNRRDRSRRVVLRFSISSDRLVIAVRDEGRGLEESDIPDPLDAANLLKPGGRGIFFVRSFMDNVSFRLCPEGGHEIIMEKSRITNQGEQNDN